MLSASSLEPCRTVTVRAGGMELWDLNELQWVRGEIWANIFRQDRLAAIDPASGEVRCFVDLESILTWEERRRLPFEQVRRSAWPQTSHTGAGAPSLGTTARPSRASSACIAALRRC